MREALVCFLVSFLYINKVELVFVETSFVAMPMPQNISSLYQKECSPLASSFTRKSKHVFVEQDFFYMRSADDETTDDTFRLSTAECFQLPEVFFALKNVQSECRMLSERVVNNCNFNEMDCTGVPFAKDLCVNCKSKSCPTNVTCYVLAGKCSRWYSSKKYVTGEKDIDGNWVCVPGFYGWMCSSKCSRHCVNGECHHINGTCLQGCNFGWKGEKCAEPDCPPNTYGLTCNMTCSPNCVGTCKSVDGTCWCKDGWSNNNKGVLCNKPCEPGLYGQRCESSCGDCLEGTVCSPENGFCPNGCNKPGFYNTGLYNQECKHYEFMRGCRFDEYGRNCENKCSSTCDDNYCRNEDGKCFRCPPGVYIGQNCTTECSPGTFGKNCYGRCRCDGGAPCDPVSGRCPGECEEGYEGKTCSMKKCEPGLYGNDCDKWCFCKDRKPCNRIFGYCPDDCQRGWRGSSCEYRKREKCLDDRRDDSSLITWEPRSLGIGIAVGFVSFFILFGSGFGRLKKIVKM